MIRDQETRRSSKYVCRSRRNRLAPVRTCLWRSCCCSRVAQVSSLSRGRERRTHASLALPLPPGNCLFRIGLCRTVPHRAAHRHLHAGQRGAAALTAGMARGDAYHRQHLSLYSEARKQDLAFQRELAEEVEWAERTRE